MNVTYLDNNATTRLRPEALEAMMPFLTERYGNPSSAHRFGADAAAPVEQARGDVARAIGARPDEIVFTAGGTEADNTALRGVLAARPNRRHVVISRAEHEAILAPAEALEREEIEVTRLDVDGQGRTAPENLGAALRDDTALVSVMLANNETGVLAPVEALARVAHERGALFHSDAVNALGKVAIDVERLGVDLLSVSAHKAHGPKGVGALFVRRGTPFRAMLLGGRQERERRGGTLNAAGIVGFGAACAALTSEPGEELERVRALRDRLEVRLRERFPGLRVMGGAAPRVPNTCCVCLPGVEAEAALLLLSEAGICASSGAACASGSLEPSHVLAAMGVAPEVARGQLRFSLSRYSSDEDVDRLLDALPKVVERVSAAL